MNREDILSKSRSENKNRDIYENEVLKDGGNVASAVAVIIATVFFALQIFVGLGMNYGLYAIVFLIPATRFTVKAIKLKRRHDVLVAALYIIVALIFSIAHVHNLFSKSTIL